MTMSMLLGYLESVGSRKGMLKPGVVVSCWRCLVKVMHVANVVDVLRSKMVIQSVHERLCCWCCDEVLAGWPGRMVVLECGMRCV